MVDFKIPEGEKFFAFMVWVALIGAALILAIDYSTKRQVLNALMELKGEINGQSGKAGATGPAISNSGKPGNVGIVSMDDATGLETANDIEHVPFPVRAANGQPRDASGKFAPKTADDPGRGNDSEIQPGNSGVES